MKSQKELYYYIWIIQLIIILFLILGIIMLYNNQIHIFYNLVIILMFIIVVFIQNNLILAELELIPQKEGLSNYDCFKLYSVYATNQYKTDEYDTKLKNLITQMKIGIRSNTDAFTKFSTDLKTQLESILEIISNNIKNIMEKANAWNSQYTTTLKGMNNMMNTLYDINTNLDTSKVTEQNFTIV